MWHGPVWSQRGAWCDQVKSNFATCAEERPHDVSSTALFTFIVVKITFSTIPDDQKIRCSHAHMCARYLFSRRNSFSRSPSSSHRSRSASRRTGSRARALQVRSMSRRWLSRRIRSRLGRLPRSRWIPRTILTSRTAPSTRACTTSGCGSTRSLGLCVDQLTAL